MPQVFDNAAIGLGGRSSIEDVATAGEVTADEFQLGQGEIGKHEAQRIRDLVDPETRILLDDVDLEGLLFVVLLERLIIVVGESPPFRFSVDLDGHRGAEYALATIEQ